MMVCSEGVDGIGDINKYTYVYENSDILSVLLQDKTSAEIKLKYSA